jgi:site-specific DNA recombinase
LCLACKEYSLGRPGPAYDVPVGAKASCLASVKMSPIGRDYLACGNARRQGACTNKRGIRRHILEALILDGLKSRLMAPELVKEFIAEFHQEVNRQRRDQEIEQGLRRREFDEVARKVDGLINAIVDGLRTAGLKSKLEELEHRKRDLQAVVETATPPLPRLHPNLAELYRQKVANLQEALSAPDTHAEALEILRGLIERVVLHRTESGLEIELIGEIAAMIDLGAQNKTAGPKGSAVPDPYRRSVKVVAGTGFEPVTFRL